MQYNNYTYYYLHLMHKVIMNDNRYCVIMCGGVGSRFWPYSRASYPKQFIDFMGTGRSLLQMSYDRIKDVVNPDNIVVVANEMYAELIRQQLPLLNPKHILLEPARRNTAPCIAWATNHIRAINPDASIMVAPSDHLILKEEQFKESIRRGFDFVEHHDALLTLGIKPSRPETGYGYIQVGESVNDEISKVKTFTEKPNLELAKVFIQLGEFFWNSGIFIWSANSIYKALHDYAPEVCGVLDRGEGIYGTPAEMAFINEAFPSCQNISIDFAVMEKASNVYVECVDFGWSDLGTWGSLYENSPKAADENVIINGKAMLYESKHNMIATKHEKVVVAVGLNNYIVADAGDVLLICPMSEEQRIKHFVNNLKVETGDKYL